MQLDSELLELLKYCYERAMVKWIRQIQGSLQIQFVIRRIFLSASFLESIDLTADFLKKMRIKNYYRPSKLRISASFPSQIFSVQPKKLLSHLFL